MTNFLLNSAICLAAFYGFYHCLLRRETFFNLNRFYLLATAALALLIPALKIEIFKNEPTETPVLQQLPQVIEQIQVAPRAVETGLSRHLSPGFSLSIGEVSAWFYLAVAGVFALIFLSKMARLFWMLRRCRLEKNEGFTLADLPGEPMPAASFFGFVFWKKDAQADPLIFQHELAHVKGWHSVDVILAEILVIFQWFNPMAWSLRRSLRAVHEYIADDWVVRNTQRRFDYAQLLVRNWKLEIGSSRLGSCPSPSLPDNFRLPISNFHSQLKSRLVMLSKSPSRKISLGKYLLALPLAASLMLLFSFRLVEKIELPTALDNALSRVGSIAEKISEMPVYQAVESDDPKSSRPGNQPVFVAESTPYIFYWGQFQAKIQQLEGTDHFFGEVNLAVLDFMQAIDREPRLWNGRSLESLVSFKLTDANGLTTAIRSNYQNAEAYFQCRKTLNERYLKIEGGGHFVISDLALPNGKTARIDLFFAQEENTGPKSVRRESNFGDMSPDQRKALFGPTTDFVWGKFLDSRNFTRTFFTAEEFFETIATAPIYIVDGTENQEVIGKATIFVPKADPIEITFQTGSSGREQKYQPYEKCLERLRAMKSEIRPGTQIYLDFENFPGSKSGNGNYAVGAVMKIVSDGSPLRDLRPSDKALFSFRWGNFFRGIEMYGRRFQNSEGQSIWADGRSILEHYESSANEIKQMLELSPQLWRTSEMLSVPVFKMKFQGTEAEFVPGKGFPKEFMELVRKNIRPGGEPLEISGIRSEQWDISPFEIHFYPQAEASRPSLSPGKNSQGLERGLVMLPISPNPVSGGDALAVFELPEAANVRLVIYREDMRQVTAFSKECHSGRNELTVPAANLTESGVYVCVLETPFGLVREKFVVQ